MEKLGEIGQLSEDMQIEFPLWRIWKETGTPIRELKEDWTMPDVMKALAVLDMYSAYETANSEMDNFEMEQSMKNKR